MTRDEIKTLAKKCYPEYKGRKFFTRQSKEYQMSDYWSEGSRNYAVAVRLATGETGLPGDFVHNPMNGGAHARFEIPAGIAIVERSVFCGKDCGITVYVAPLPALTGDDVVAMIEGR